MGYAGEKKREYQLQWMTRRRLEWIKSQGGACVRCGAINDLQVDHIDPALKEVNVSRVWSCSRGVRERELAKCQVLCGDCHRVKTGEGARKRRQACPSRSAYRYGCRCRACKDIQAEYMRAWRAKEWGESDSN